MEDYMSFKQALRGFDRDEVLEYIRKQEEDFNARTIAMEREIRKRDKIISELKNRIVVKDEQVNRLEREIRGKYQKYIDNYRQIGDLVYESKLKGQRILDEAHAEASRIIAGADAEAKKRVLSVQGQIDQKLTEGKHKYLAVQDEMNEIVEMFNQMQRKFMQSYKEVHEIIQSMPASLSDIAPGDDDEDEYTLNTNLDFRSLGNDFDDDFDDDEFDDDFGEYSAAGKPDGRYGEGSPSGDRVEDTAELAKMDGAKPADVERNNS